MIICSGYKCKCREYRFARKNEFYNFCECEHTLNNHQETSSLKEVATTTATTPDNKSKSVISTSKTTLTPAEVRARLKAAGIPVGQRGRLSTEQMAKAAKLFTHNNN